ncbi:MAG: ESPR-type extended signal peptide-containing protein [Dialister sp.]|nr:ESPR-type extended signal peptide-containing protein [Dialister sp.]
MNKIYKLVWSKVRNTWVVASEIAKGHGKESSSGRNGKRLKLAVMTAILGGCFMTAGISPVTAELTKDQKAVYDAVLQKLETEKKTVHYFSVKSDDSANPDGTNWNNDGATGNDAVAAGRYAKAYGNQSQATGRNAWAIGAYSQASGYNAVAAAEKGIDAAAYNALSVEEKKNYILNTQSEGRRDTSLYYRTKFKEYTKDEFNALPVMERHFLEAEKGYSYDKEKQVWTITPGAVAIGHAAKAIGLSTLAVGDLAEATSKYAVAVGREAEATDVGNTALGYYAKAKGLRSTALGVATRATDFESMAVGPYARAEGKVSLALGSNAHAKGNNSIAMGRRSESTGESSIALGGSAKTQAQGSVAIGMMAESRQKGSVALGEASLADREAGVWGRDISTGEAMNEDTLLGAGKAAYDAEKTKLTELQGQEQALRNEYEASLAQDQVAPNGNHIPSAATQAIKNKLDAKIVEVDTQAIKVANTVKTWRATSGALSVGNTGLAVTRQITGVAAGTEDTDAVNVAQLKALNTKVDKGAIHYFSVKSDDSAKPAGTNWNNDGATGQDAIAIGKNAVSEGQDAIAIGKNAVSDRQESTAIGSQAQAYQYYSTAIGSTAIAGSHYSTALGYGAQADWTYSTALGGNADAQGLHSTALGGIAKAQGHYSTVLGYKAEALADGSVALGNDAVAGREAGTVGYFASASGTTLDDVLTALDKKTDYDNWTATINASKAEYERLTNAYFNASESDKAAAKAALDTWKEQHKAFVKALEERTRLEATWKASRGAVSVGADGFDEAGNTIIESRQITNVAAGTEDTDAVNVAQLKVVNEKADKNATDITNLTKTVNANGKATIVKVDGKEESTDGNLKITKKTENGQTTYDLSLSDEITIGKDGKDGKIGINGKDGASAEITVGKGEPGVDGKDGETITRIIYTDKDGKEHKVATLDDGLKFKGDNDTVVTRKLNTQLNITGGITDKAELSNNNIGVVGTQDGGMAIKLSKKLKGLTSAEFVDGDKVTNITAQTITQKDGDNITNITGGNVTITRKEGNVDLWELNKTVNNITAGTTDVSSWKLQANGKDERIIKKDSVVNFKNGENTKVTVNGNDVTVDLNDATKKQISDNTTKINEIDGKVTNIENKVNNIETNIDTKIEQKIEGAKITVEGDTTTGVKATEVKTGDKVTGYKVSLDKKVTVGNVTIDGKDDKGEITGLTNTTIDADDFATKGRAATEEQLKKAMAATQEASRTMVKAGDNITVTPATEGASEYTVSLKKDISVDSVTANEYKVGDKTYINDKGINANGNTITNVADGKISEDSKEAVNGSQIYAMNQQTINNMNQINSLRDESREGDALGAAMAALKPLDFDPYQRNQIMAGVGYYRGKEAVALGLAHYKNEDLMIHGGLAYAGNSELMANAGFSYRFGSSENREAKKARNLRMPQYDKGPISSVYILQDEVERLTKENKEANDRIAALEAKLEKVLEKVK